MEPVPATTIALGGEPITVRHLDGTEEIVTVRLLKVVEYPAYLAALEDEERLAELVCGKPAGWAAGLVPESLLDLCEKATVLNFSPARRWAERRARVAEGLLPIAQRGQRMQEALGNFAPTAPSSSAGA